MCYGDNPGDMACYVTRLDSHNFVSSFKHPQLKSTLDICHMMLGINIDCLAQSEKPLRIADYISIYSDTIGLVYLKNTQYRLPNRIKIY